jgi:hypothetical protein
MSFKQVLNEVNIISTSGDTSLAITRYDQLGMDRFLLRDLSHQTETRSNYVNNLEQICQDKKCNKVILNVNEISESFYNKLVTFCNFILLDARKDMLHLNGFNYFIVLNSFDENDGHTVWAPSYSSNCVTERDLDEYDPNRY